MSDSYVVYVDMVADLFHAGHVSFLTQARQAAEERCEGRPVRLVVGLHTDADAASYKRTPVLSLVERATAVRGCRSVDHVFEGAPVSVTASVLDRFEVDLVVHGDDYDAETLEFFYRVPMQRGVLVTVPYTASIDGSRPISSTAIIQRILARDGQGPDARTGRGQAGSAP